VRSRDLGHEMRLISCDLISRSRLEVSYETQLYVLGRLRDSDRGMVTTLFF
jgi:hypothetical protein